MQLLLQSLKKLRLAVIRTAVSAARVILLVRSIPTKGEDEISECMNFIYSFVVVVKREEVGQR